MISNPSVGQKMIQGQCRNESLARWRFSEAEKTAKIVSVVAGRNAILECDAFEKYDAKDDCARVHVAWYALKDGHTFSIGLSYWTTMTPAGLYTKIYNNRYGFFDF